MGQRKLFGKDLTEKLKTAKVLQQSSKELKIGVKSQLENKNLKNSRDPPRNQQKSYGQSKASGQKHMYNQRQKSSFQRDSIDQKQRQAPTKKN